MGKFTKEEIKKLSCNRFVVMVTSTTVFFSEEFKKLVYEETRAGKILKNVFREYGIDPAMLGEKRIEGFRYRLNKIAERTNGFTVQETEFQPSIGQKKELESNISVKQLLHELAYARQEIEFLKKLREADLEAQRRWELKHRRK